MSEAVAKGGVLRISDRAADLPLSPIRQIFNQARRMQDQGLDVIRLDIGDPDFDLPQRIADGIGTALREGKTHYSPMTGVPALREAIGVHVARRFGVAVDAESVVVHQGATQALNAALLALCDSGSSILLPEIYFPNYVQQTTLAGVQPRFYPFDATFDPDLDRLEEVYDESVKAILINSPSNPTGRLFAPATIRALYRFAREKGLWIISDEAYSDLVFEGKPLSPLELDWEYPATERRVLAIYSFSKSYAATGLRLGYTVTPGPRLAATLGALNEPLTGSTTTPLQWGMISGLAEDDTADRRRDLMKRRQAAADELDASGLQVRVPDGGIFFFLDVSATGLSGDDFALQLLSEKQVAVVPGSGFGLSPKVAQGRLTFEVNPRARRCVRISFGIPEDRLREGLSRLAAFAREKI